MAGISVFSKKGVKTNAAKIVAIGRHADYESGGHLSQTGKEQARNMANQFKFLAKCFQISRISLLTSPSRRALETAQIIAELTDTPVQLSEILWVEGRREADIKGFLELVEIQEADLIILITHLSGAEAYIAAFAQKMGDTDGWIPALEMGDICFFDCQKNSIQVLSQDEVFPQLSCDN